MFYIKVLFARLFNIDNLMTHFYIWFLAVALAMDCFAVSVASGIIYGRLRWRLMLLMASLFGFFQAFNPLVGWVATDRFRFLVESFDHWVAFGILLFLGVRMILDSFKEEEKKMFDPQKLRVIFTLAIATSIDALAVGVTFSCMGVVSLASLLYPLVVIGFVSFVFSVAGLLIGIFLGQSFARRLRAELWGGVILIIIGIKVLVEHLSVELC